MSYIITVPPPPTPDTIAAEAFDLDDVTFTPNDAGRIERATRGNVYVGDVLLDVIQTECSPDQHRFLARKADQWGEMSDWKPMRCVHEARAFLISRNKQ